MSDRNSRPNTRGGNRGSRRGGRGGAGARPKSQEKKSILDFEAYIDKKVLVKFSGGREVVGVLKGSDPLVNLVLDEAVEYLNDFASNQPTGKTRKIGLTLCRGPNVLLVTPYDNVEEVENPFLQNEGDMSDEEEEKE